MCVVVVGCVIGELGSCFIEDGSVEDTEELD